LSLPDSDAFAPEKSEKNSQEKVQKFVLRKKKVQKFSKKCKKKKHPRIFSPAALIWDDSGGLPPPTPPAFLFATCTF
jgi:hypothetical protein